MHVLDHVTLFVSDFARSKAFYAKALAPLGIAITVEFGEYCGFGRDQKPDSGSRRAGDLPAPEESSDHATPSRSSRAAAPKSTRSTSRARGRWERVRRPRHRAHTTRAY